MNLVKKFYNQISLKKKKKIAEMVLNLEDCFYLIVVYKSQDFWLNPKTPNLRDRKSCFVDCFICRVD